MNNAVVTELDVGVLAGVAIACSLYCISELTEAIRIDVFIARI